MPAGEHLSVLERRPSTISRCVPDCNNTTTCASRLCITSERSRFVLRCFQWQPGAEFRRGWNDHKIPPCRVAQATHQCLALKVLPQPTLSIGRPGSRHIINHDMNDLMQKGRKSVTIFAEEQGLWHAFVADGRLDRSKTLDDMGELVKPPVLRMGLAHLNPIPRLSTK